MTHEDQDIDAELARLAQATESVRPRAGFSSRVMQRIAEEPPSALAALRQPAWRLFPVGALLAAVALFWAVSVQGEVDEAMALSDDTELSW
jgi:hypothetical protein